MKSLTSMAGRFLASGQQWSRLNSLGTTKIEAVLRSFCQSNEGDEATKRLIQGLGAELLDVPDEIIRAMVSWDIVDCENIHDGSDSAIEVVDGSKTEKNGEEQLFPIRDDDGEELSLLQVKNCDKQLADKYRKAVNIWNNTDEEWNGVVLGELEKEGYVIHSLDFTELYDET